MSKAGDEEDEDECFYESLDRILSSSNSSCSSSSAEDYDDDDKDQKSNSDSPNYAPDRPPLPIPRFPMGVSNNYDVWISEPSSVEDRRMRLLRQMGLSRDPILSRQRPSDEGGTSRGDFGRSVSADQLNRSQQRGDISCSDSNPGIVRSKSDGATDHHHHHRIKSQCNSHSPLHSPQILLINNNSISPPVVNEIGGPFVNNNRSVVKSPSGNGSPVINAAASLNKPPTSKNCRRVEDNMNDSTSLNPGGNCNSMPVSGNASGGGELDGDLGCNGIGPVCTIKNLDTGKEFVVNEVREDGTWNKLKEVGTGRQLTMEEFEMCVGHSPIVQELMRRQNVEDGNRDDVDSNANGSGGSGSKFKKKGSWLKSIRNVASTMTGYKDRRSSDERDTSSEKGGRRSSSATDDSQDVSFHGPERVRVRQYGKSCKEITALYKSQEIRAHSGSIWTIKFSLDGKYLASAGEDCVIHVWQVVETERKGDLLMDKPVDGNSNLLFFANGSPEPTSVSPNLENHPEKKRRGRSSTSRKSVSLDQILVPETVFALSEKPICSFQGHLNDVLDLSWSKSQHLLSSSMDKTVRLWHLSSKSCLKVFSHSDFVTCIQFNPVDDRFFISGSIDAKVRIWSIPDRQVVDWNDLHEMVTAACYTPDGQGALVGSYKGSCHLYNTSENKLQQKGQINLQNKKKKSHHKKITGFQFAPGSSSEVLITSADSRIRVIEGVDLVHKFKGFRNTNSQISASLTANGNYVVSASEDSHVYVWKHEGDSQPSRSKGVTVTRSYEHFHCQDVSMAIPWPGMCDSWGFQDRSSGEQSRLGDDLDEVSTANHPPTPVEEINGNESTLLASACPTSPLHGTISSATNSYFFDRISATWPEEKLLLTAKNHSPRVSVDFSNSINQSRSAWGMVIVTAGLRGEIRTFQNFGLPVRI
ncbi:WD repeat-containing protein 44 [Camellia lanceoleosa]|uniref:WD repeat-containing protein 44 n=1 Tax=Camellia lanceoleosa TaxID=1840588 RepID=A0ACC0H119_9ERIC|nr:WD repeat-containing protein 44 [Camellia lanceoleosa]